MTFWVTIRKPPWRTVSICIILTAILGVAYLCWQPGAIYMDGRFDRATNGMWLQHGWLADDSWIARNKRNETLFRDRSMIEQLAETLKVNHIRDVYPHLCPCENSGKIAPVDDEQVERFLDGLEGCRVMPWVGGVLNKQVWLDSETWRREFVESIVDLLARHPRLAGIHVNIEPLPSGTEAYLVLLDELKQAMPKGKLLSIAAYPPPSIWHRFEEVHWDESYFGEVASRSDQMVVMMYDTAIRLPKLYEQVMASWTQQCLDWSDLTDVLLGVPVYDDEGVGYHIPGVENLEHGLAGISGGLDCYETLPTNYQGVAIYCEWEMEEDEWDYWQECFISGEKP